MERCGKSAPARRQRRGLETPSGAAQIGTRHGGPPYVRVACLRRLATGVRDKWSSNDRTRLIGPLGTLLTLANPSARQSAFQTFGHDHKVMPRLSRHLARADGFSLSLTESSALPFLFTRVIVLLRLFVAALSFVEGLCWTAILLCNRILRFRASLWTARAGLLPSWSILSPRTRRMPLSRWFASVITTLDTMFPRGFWSMDASARAMMVSRAARAVCRHSRCCAVRSSKMFAA